MYVCETVYFFFVGFQVLVGAAISIDFEEFAFLPGISQLEQVLIVFLFLQLFSALMFL